MRVRPLIHSLQYSVLCFRLHIFVGWVLVFRIVRVILYSIRFCFVGCVSFLVEFISISCLIVGFACDLVFFLSSLNFIATILSSIFSRQPNHHPIMFCSVFISFSCHFTTNHINLKCCDGKILIFVWLFGRFFSFSHTLPMHFKWSLWVVGLLFRSNWRAMENSLYRVFVYLFDLKIRAGNLLWN